MFYLLLGGAPLGFCYKAVNTLDSMVGYRNEKYLDFGRASAKCDDVWNFIPSRIAGVLFCLAAALTGADCKNAFAIFKRDRKKHASPNSAQTEAACAGALHLQLAGDSWYFGKLHHKPTIGDPDREIEPQDITRANRLMFVSAGLFLLIGGGLCSLLLLL
jgi:adenosylcobinamide-phosphate synthase